VECSGFQFKVAEGDVIKVPLIKAEKDTEVVLDRVLLTGDAEKTTVGTPLVAGTKVTAVVVEHGKDKKVLVMKKKRRKDYKRKNGHRQQFTKLKIVSIA